MPASTRPTRKTKEILVGDTVYARFFGEKQLKVTAIAKTGLKFPHYICSVDGKSWLISKLYLSTKSIKQFTEDDNFKQGWLLADLNPLA